MPPRRLERHPLTLLRRGPPVTFHHNGRPVPGFAGEPVAVALYARGRRVVSRSMRYHRPRGYFCGVGHCTHCFVRLNGVPNVRSCEAPCEGHAWAEDQNAVPSVEHDVLGLADWAFPHYLDAHRAFIRPTILKPLFTRMIRGMAGFGRVPKAPVPQSFRHEQLETDLLVVGAGPAGLAAAEAAGTAGLRVTLLERSPQLGGRLSWLPTPFHATSPDAPRTEGKALVEESRRRLQAAGVDVRPGARLFGIYPGSQLAAATASALLRVRARGLVLAPGALDDYPPIPGGDRAGVLLSSGALRMLNEFGVLPGESVAIVGAGRDGLLLARDLIACGARVSGLVDPRPARSSLLTDDLRRMGVAVRWETRAVSVRGRKSPRALEVEGPGGHRARISCDAVVLATGRHPAVELFQQAGCRIRHQGPMGGFHPETDARGRTSVPHLWAAGSAAGVVDEWASHLGGRLAGLAAARALKAPSAPSESALEEVEERLRTHRRRLGLAAPEVAT